MREERRDFVKGLGAMLGLGRARFRRVDPAASALSESEFGGDEDLVHSFREVGRSFGEPLDRLRMAPETFADIQGWDLHTLDLPEPLACERNGVVLAWAAGTFLDDGGG